MQPPEITCHVIRVVGPSGSGKSLFITSLQEALRTIGVRSAAVTRIGNPTDGTAAITVAVSSGSRSTIDREVPLGYLATVVGWIDPGVEVVLAEDYAEAGAPAIEIRPPGAAPFALDEAERFAVVDPAEIAQHFAADGPGYTAGVAERIVQELLGREVRREVSDAPPSPPASTNREEPGRLARLIHRLLRFRAETHETGGKR